MKRAGLLILVLVFTAVRLPGNPEAEEILRNLPAPEVNYHLPPINASLPAVLQPAAYIPPVSDAEKIKQKQLKKTFEQLKTSMDEVITRPVKKIASEVNRPAVKTAAAAATATSRIAHPLPTETASPSADAGKAKRPGPIETAAAKIRKEPPQKPLAVASAVATVPINTASGTTVSPANQNSLATAVTEITASESISVPEDQNDQTVTDAVSDAADSEATDVIATAHDAVFAKATGLYKKQDWKGLKELFSENQEAGETAEGLKYRAEAEMNAEKPNVMQIRRFGDQLLAANADDPMGNLAMAYYFANNKKPDTTKALKHLDMVFKSKSRPTGASSLYWNIILRKYALILLIIIAALAGGISNYLKKRRSMKIELDLAAPNNEEAFAANMPATEKTGFKAKISGTISALLQKFKKSPAAKSATKSTDFAKESSSEELPLQNSESVSESAGKIPTGDKKEEVVEKIVEIEEEEEIIEEIIEEEVIEEIIEEEEEELLEEVVEEIVEEIIEEIIEEEEEENEQK